MSAEILDLRHDIFGGGIFAPPHLPTLGSQCCQLNPSSLHTFARIVLNIRGAQVHCYHPVVYWNSSWTASSKPSVSSETTNATNASFLLFMCVGPCVSAKGPDVVILLQQALLTYNQSLGVMSVMTKVLRVATVPLVTRTGVTRPRCIFSHSKGRLASMPVLFYLKLNTESIALTRKSESGSLRAAENKWCAVLVQNDRP